MKNNLFFVDSKKLSAEALKKKHRIENDPSSRTNHMEYMEGMEPVSYTHLQFISLHVGNIDISCVQVHHPIKVLQFLRM